MTSSVSTRRSTRRSPSPSATSDPAVAAQLVSNAVKSGAPGAPIRVVLAGGESEGRLEVTNSGPPIAPSALSEIFEPLKRGLGGGDREERDSVGLGLFIVREIARAHGGEVQVRSPPGETTFTVRLPRRAPLGRP